jgi:triphosphoribosyl-dephospho-CoA synthase
VLLLAPLAHAALAPAPASLRERVRGIIAHTTIRDAAAVYDAIRMARAGGLGDVPREDVAASPTVTLAAAMELASDRDDIAREYATAFERTFTVGAPALVKARAAGLEWADAVTETFLVLLAAAPDTLIARKLGPDAAGDISRDAAAVLAAGGVRTNAGRRALSSFDLELRDLRNTRNPGTTADITAAAIFVVLLNGGWKGGWER